MQRKLKDILKVIGNEAVLFVMGTIKIVHELTKESEASRKRKEALTKAIEEGRVNIHYHNSGCLGSILLFVIVCCLYGTYNKCDDSANDKSPAKSALVANNRYNSKTIKAEYPKKAAIPYSRNNTLVGTSINRYHPAQKAKKQISIVVKENSYYCNKKVWHAPIHMTVPKNNGPSWSISNSR